LWPCEAWRFNWTNGSPPDEVVTWVRYEEGKPIPVETDLEYERERFGYGAIVKHSFFSSAPIQFDYLNQWKTLDCQNSEDIQIERTNGLPSLINLRDLKDGLH